jgi:hypothetical protein
MKRSSLCVLGFVLAAFSAGANESASSVENPVYRQRADKIVATLGLNDAAKLARVRDAIAAHYQGVNAIDDSVDQRIKELKQPGSADKSAVDAEIKSVREQARPKLEAVHADFISQLARDLTPAQIDQVKDGLTYGVLPLTFRVYQEMLPNLTAEQKDQILAWLTEAREFAIDAGSSEEKHAWFGKYKGKINNYLAKAGYDMKQAEKELSARSKAATAKK